MLQPIKIIYNCDVIIFNEKITFRASNFDFLLSRIVAYDLHYRPFIQDFGIPVKNVPTVIISLNSPLFFVFVLKRWKTFLSPEILFDELRHIISRSEYTVDVEFHTQLNNLQPLLLSNIRCD